MKSAMVFKSVPLALCSLLAAGAWSPAFAQSTTPAESVLNDKFVLDAGMFIANFQMKARLDGTSSTNPEYDFGKDFGGDDSNATRYRLDGLWRITPKHHLRIMYFDNTKTAARNLDKDIVWGGVTYHAGAHVELETKQNIIEFAYEWAFLREPTYEVAGTFGIHYQDLSLKLSGNATAGTGTTVTFTSKSSSVPVPMPVIGIRAGWAVSPNWYLDVNGQIFKAKVGDYDGTIWDMRANATYMFNKTWGAGLGYDIFATSVDVSKNDFHGKLRFGYSGFQAFVKIGF